MYILLLCLCLKIIGYKSEFAILYFEKHSLLTFYAICCVSEYMSIYIITTKTLINTFYMYVLLYGG